MTGVKQSNNTAELFAAIKAIEYLMLKPVVAHIHTDSSYVMLSLSNYHNIYRVKNGLDQKGKPVVNFDLIERIYSLIVARQYPVVFKKVKAHDSCLGNISADHQAKLGAQLD